MALVLETINKGNVENFGFLSFNTNQVHLGELPEISLPQFCRYATETLLLLFEKATPDEKNEIRRIISRILELNDQDEINYQQEKDESRYFIEALHQGMDELDAPHNYPENSFKEEENGVSIGQTYLVDKIQFTEFVGYILAGGFVGWGSRTMPECTRESIRKLIDLL